MRFIVLLFTVFILIRGSLGPGMGGLKKNGQVAKVVAPTYHGPLGGSCRAEKRGALPGGGWRRHCGAPAVGPRRPATRLGAARGSRVEEAATLREMVTRVGRARFLTADRLGEGRSGK